MLSKFIQQNNLSESFFTTANQYYLPLANKLALKCQQKMDVKDCSPYFVGVNGCQGSGKSTLVEFLALYLKDQFNLSVVVLSLDDFYLNQDKRQQLAADIHPLFKYRGVPATHDTKLLKKVLLQLKDVNSVGHVNEIIRLPRFDKAQDNPLAKQYWPNVTSKVDIVLLEGWCWGVPAQIQQDLHLAINDLETEQDPLVIWREYANEALQNDYQPLYPLMDLWLMLKAPSFNVVYQWRLEQEQKLAQATIASNKVNKVMDTQALNKFIQLFQRLTEHGLKELPDKVDILFELDQSRKIIASRGID